MQALTDRELGIMMEIIDSLDDINPNAGVKIKFTFDGFILYYIAAENIDYKDSPLHRAAMETGTKNLDDVESELKRLFKEQTKKTLSYEKIEDGDTLEALSPALQRYYVRLFRTFRFKLDKREEE